VSNGIGLGREAHTRAYLGENTNGNPDSSEAAVTDRASQESSNNRGNSDSARDFAQANGREASRAHADYEADLHRPSANVATVMITRVQSDPQGRMVDKVLVASGVKPAAGVVALQAFPELFATSAGAQDQAEKGGAENLDRAGEVEESPISASAQVAGLLGNPLSFDLDSLAREAQYFFAQIDHLSQDLASMLARINVPSWSLAVAMAFTAAAVARRRFRKTHRGSVVDDHSGTAFACYPELGGSWTWEES
jgi:hypothetical protein